MTSRTEELPEAVAPPIRITINAPEETSQPITCPVASAVKSWWAEERLPGVPDIDISHADTETDTVAVEAAGMPLRISGRRWEHAGSAAVKYRRSYPETLIDPQRWVEHIWTERDSLRPTLATHVVDAMLRSGTTEIRAAAGLPEIPTHPPGPVQIQLPPSVLRELTSLPSATISESIADVAQTINASYGVQMPGLRLQISHESSRQARLRFGRVATQAFLVTVGEPTALLEELASLLATEISLRLALWVPPEASAWEAGLGDLSRSAEAAAHHLPTLRRRLLEQRASVSNSQALAEAILRVLAGRSEKHWADDPTIADAIEDQARLALGAAVLGRATQYGELTVITEENPGDHASPAELRASLLDRHSALRHAITDIVLRVPAANRRVVATALRPLADVIRVVAIEEFAVTPVLADRWRTIHEQGVE